MTELGDVRHAFEVPDLFNSSPLYRSLCGTVTGSDALLELASRGHPGQQPAILFFGAVHRLLLRGADHELAEFYPSIVERPRPADRAGAALVSFCAENYSAVAALIEGRLVQTSQVQRSLALRLGLCAIACQVAAPVHLVEVGASAGLNLRFDRYGYQLAGHQFGDRHSKIQLVADWYDALPPLDLDALPEIASVVGVDLNPIDPTDEDARQWLDALVWPENSHQRVLLAAALALVAADPPDIRRGDAVDVLPVLAGELPAGAPRVVFHAATRMHVPLDRRADFDSAIASVGAGGPLYVLSLEAPPDPDPRPLPSRPGVALNLRGPDGSSAVLAVAEAHLRWVEPCVPIL